MENEQLKNQDELLGEQVSDSELRELLKRLGEVEFGSPGGTTVAAIVEGTGASPIEVGRLLGQIRAEGLERRFTETFSDHEERIGELETTRPLVREINSERALADRAAKARDLIPAAMIIFVALIVAIAVFALTSVQPPIAPR